MKRLAALGTALSLAGGMTSCEAKPGNVEITAQYENHVMKGYPQKGVPIAEIKIGQTAVAHCIGWEEYPSVTTAIDDEEITGYTYANHYAPGFYVARPAFDKSLESLQDQLPDCEDIEGLQG